MAVTLNASTSSGFIATSDTSGVLELQNNGTTRMTVNSSGVSFAAQPLIGGVAPPAFSAYSTVATTLGTGVETKIFFQTEEYDTNSNYNASTSIFQPTVAGYYLINSVVAGNGVQTGGYFSANIYKNGSKFLQTTASTEIGIYVSLVSGVVYCNGTTDYIEIFAGQYSGVTRSTFTGIDASRFQGTFLRGA